MDYYHLWANIKDSSKDLEFAENVKSYLGFLQEKKLIEGFRISRRKLGFGPSELGEYHVVMETENLAQLDKAFHSVKGRAGQLEQLHHGVYSHISELKTALYRDFPDR